MPKVPKKNRDCSKKKGDESKLSEWLWHLLLGLWILAIYLGSDLPGSGENYWNPWVFATRKGYHIFEFFVLAALVFKATGFYGIDLKMIRILTVAVAISFAILDEFHQLFVFGREGTIRDIGFDLIGILIFLAFNYFYSRKSPFKKSA